MDETLIKATLNLKQVPNFNAMATLYKGSNGVQIYIKTRPFMKDVLRQLRSRFELILFTSGSKPYASCILS